MEPLSLRVYTRIQGRYRLVVSRPDKSIRVDTGWFDNLITNNGMEQIALGNGSTPDLCTQCFIGRSANTPLITDAQLGSIVATANSVNSAVYTYFAGVEPFWRAYKIFTFNAGNATGDIREVGCGFSPTNLFSRSLIWGVEEVPATITVLADEKLEVYYERRNYLDIRDLAGSFVLSTGGVNSTILTTSRIADIDVVPDIFKGHLNSNNVSLTIHAQKALVPITDPLSSPVGAEVSTQAAYIANSHYLDYIFQYTQEAGVFTGGIGTAQFNSNQCRFQFLFTPYIQKVARYRMRLAVRTSWSRYIPAL